ncbi:MBL fold metallo-hydrolase [Parvularcula sp. LCG005]|uniref:MBL fold metallo-hydrolase n=1 Tax=Parvularcula sp. LCG005 TaxID=3078805 RepID=UPI00294203C8|nr:MBL fold metallo-hydrolase [Parvularcula sp. LCG005]WOI52174.1 MBL fold metallo-hydrolase [Parvularcula sp. LCG005]
MSASPILALPETIQDHPYDAPQVEAFFDEATNTVSYVVYDQDAKAAAIIDSLLDFDNKSGRTTTVSADRILNFIAQKALSVDLILETHVHADHLSAAPYLKEKLGGRIAIGSDIKTVQYVFGKVFNAGTAFQRDGSQFDVLFDDGATFEIGRFKGVAIHTPGHTPACMSYLIGDALFVGDTIFMPDFGTARCDFPGGDAATLFRSIRRLFLLPDDTRMFLCHDYKSKSRDDYAWEATIGVQKKENIHVHDGVTEAEFVKMRTERDSTLAMPTLILPSVQVNMNAGHLPDPEDNGQQYLKIPLNAL